MAWVDFLDCVAQKHGDKIALKEQESGRFLTYSTLVKEVDALAWALGDNGVTKGDRICYLRSNSLEHITLLLASARLGAIFIPMNFRLSTEELIDIAARVTPKIFIGDDRCQLNLGDKFSYKTLAEIPPLYHRGPFATVPSDMDDPLLMLFTSGTTGTPKGVMFHGEMLASNQEQTCRHWGLQTDDITLIETPFFHTGGHNVLCLPLLTLGGTCILAPKFDLDNLYHTIEKEQLTVYFAVPTMFQMLAEDDRFHTFSFKSLRFLVSGGAYCPQELIEKYQKKGLTFKQGFGLTEVGPNCFLLPEEEAIRKVGSIGKPMPHSDVLIVTEKGTRAKPQEVGELLIRGPHLCKGYYNEPQLFQNSLFDGYFKTGDLAKYDEEGFFFIVGRKKDMYISGGENVYPAEVEKKILSHDSIHEAVVVAVKSDKWGEVGHCYLRSDRDWNVTKLRHFLDPLLSRYKHPHYVVCLQEFPLLANGKIDRKKLREQAAQLR